MDELDHDNNNSSPWVQDWNKYHSPFKYGWDKAVRGDGLMKMAKGL